MLSIRDMPYCYLKYKICMTEKVTPPPPPPPPRISPGAPSESQTFEYAKTILSLMTKETHPQGKILIIGGGIANFTNVASTFKGIVRALTEYQHEIKAGSISIFVRRGGPNYQEGLRLMRDTGNRLGLMMHVFGPETHMTAIVGMGLGVQPIPAGSDLSGGKVY